MITTVQPLAVPDTAPVPLQADGLVKRFGPVTALAGVDLRLRPGSVHGLLGRNGAGKTTLLRIVLGLVRPDAGTVTVLGRSPFGSPGAALRGIAGFVETPRFYPYLSVMRNLELLAALDGGHDRTRIRDVVDLVGLAEYAGRKAATLSTGTTQRLGLAAALLRDPDLLVLDEPTSGLDPAGMSDLHALLTGLAAAGRTVLLSSHDMAEVDELCDGVTVLRRGKVAWTGALDELRAQAPSPTHRLTTSDDELAVAVAADRREVEIRSGPGGLVVHADEAALDDYVLYLGRAGVAVRALSRRGSALEALFTRLTADEPEASDD